MSGPAAVVGATRRSRRRWPQIAADTPWRVTWSAAAAVRSVRATIIVTGLFAITLVVIRDTQMCLFATFGALATLVFTNFAGTRREILTAHAGLALTAGAAVVIGTLVNGTTWLAALATIPVAFAIFFGGVIGPNAAGGVNSALLAYVLAVASPGTLAAIPSRVAGWWLASVICAAAVILLSPKSPEDKLRAGAAQTAAALGHQLRAAVRGAATPADMAATLVADQTLTDTFAATPYRPTGVATADQAMANVVQILQWCTALTADASDGHADPSRAAAADRDLLGTAADVLTDTAALLSGAHVRPDLDRLEAARTATRAGHQRDISGDPDAAQVAAAQAYQAQVIAVAARTAAADALIATRRADPETIAAARRRWYGQPEAVPPQQESRYVTVGDSLAVVSKYAGLRSVWFRNAIRGSVALALAVAVTDLSGVSHGFWVVLGTLSALRTSVAATESTAWRALVGTTIGFAIGAGLLAAIGTGPVALWIVLPIAVLVATYTPGTAPFIVGQAAFTLTNVVAFNLLTPADWRVGLVRTQDVAIGCAVSLVVGTLFWPRGAGPVVADNLSDALRAGSAYLRQAVDWALGVRRDEPDTATAAVDAGTRLDDALRTYLTEQGAKRLSKEDLWQLVMAGMRLRLTAHSLAGRRRPAPTGEAAAWLQQRAAELAAFYDRVATQVGPPQPPAATTEDPAPVPDADAVAVADTVSTGRLQFFWVHEHLQHLRSHVGEISGPAGRLAEIRQRPWWR